MTQENRDTVWNLFDQCLELYTEEVRDDWYGRTLALSDYTPDENGVYHIGDEEKDKETLNQEKFKEKYPELCSSVKELVDCIAGNFPDPIDLTEDEKNALIEEIGFLFREKYTGDYKDREVSDTAFPVWMMRCIMSYRKFPRVLIIENSNWKSFTEKYGEYILEA